MLKKIFIITLLVAIEVQAAVAPKLVSDQSIELQKKMTSIHNLKNNIPVIFRNVPDSDILNVTVYFTEGAKDSAEGKKSLGQMAFSAMPLGAKGFPKSEVVKLMERYSIGIACSASVESGSCSLDTINDYWDKAYPLFGAIVTDPLMDAKELELVRAREISEVRGWIQSPERYVGDVVNRVYYPPGHPYKQPINDMINELQGFKRDEIVKYHQDLLNSSGMYIVVVGSLSSKRVISDLQKVFGKIGPKKTPQMQVSLPEFDAKNNFAFESRKIPTAYIRAKFNALKEGDPDEVAAELMVKILDEELGDEVRTRQSLSYSVFSAVAQFSVGIGVIGASTSHPQETLVAIGEVIERMKNKKLSPEELEEHKRVYATHYFLSQEQHSNLGEAIGSSYLLSRSTDRFYDRPKKLEVVTPDDIQRLAKKLLVKMRVGVVYDSEKFKPEWAQAFIQKVGT